jgi:hypothetical protein
VVIGYEDCIQLLSNSKRLSFGSVQRQMLSFNGDIDEPCYQKSTARATHPDCAFPNQFP